MNRVLKKKNFLYFLYFKHLRQKGICVCLTSNIHKTSRFTSYTENTANALVSPAVSLNAINQYAEINISISIILKVRFEYKTKNVMLIENEDNYFFGYP